MAHHSTLPLLYTFTVMFLTALGLFSVRGILKLRYGPMERWNLTQTQLVQAIDVSAYFVTWYSISIGMTMFNKYFLKHWEGGYPFVITMSSIHMILKFVLSRCFFCCSARGDGSKIQRIPTRAYWLYVIYMDASLWIELMNMFRLAVPIGLFTAADIFVPSPRSWQSLSCCLLRGSSFLGWSVTSPTQLDAHTVLETMTNVTLLECKYDCNKIILSGL